MIATSKSVLQRQVEIFLANAVDPEMQAILNQSGCDAACLNQGQDLLQTWRESEIRAGVLDGDKKEATLRQHEARKAAHREIVWLGRMIRGEFGQDNILLTKLGLQPRSRAAGNGHQPQAHGPEAGNGASDPVNGNGKKRSTRKRATTLAAEIARGQRLCAAIAILSDEERNKLAQVGWNEDRIRETAALIEAVATADNAKQRTLQVKQAAVAEAGNNKMQMERWFRRAVRMAKEAVDRHDPHNRERLLTRLGQ
ncbi:MAG TPA: hypothetical protein PKD98_24990 [Anaerolineae bacterium]|nr:hypothetical protein [Anaerolineae bacterium]